jgi:hypothetical protein
MLLYPRFGGSKGYEYDWCQAIYDYLKVEAVKLIED